MSSAYVELVPDFDAPDLAWIVVRASDEPDASAVSMTLPEAAAVYRQLQDVLRRVGVPVEISSISAGLVALS